MVERGLGVGLVPDIGAALVRGRSLCRLALPRQRGDATLPTRQLGVLSPRGSSRQRWIDSLIACARAALADEVGGRGGGRVDHPADAASAP